MHEIVLAADTACKRHYGGPGQPERPERFDAALETLLPLELPRLDRRSATLDEIALCHSRSYIYLAEREIAAGFDTLSTGDTPVCEASFEAALAAAGSVLNGVDAVAGHTGTRAFSIVRPPGHHATPNRGMGFCIFNNVAIAVRHAQKHHGVGRVLIADWDVHHGNGTQDIFYEDASVFFFSTHQHPWYPGTGAAEETGSGAGEGCTMNCPFSAGAGREEILGAFKDRLAPAMREFKPEMVFISAGFDSRAGDPLGGFLLTDDDFVALTDVVLEIADQYAGGRVVSVLEGGYNLAGLRQAVGAHVRTLAR